MHLYSGILLGPPKGNLTLATAWIELESNILSKISQSEKDKYSYEESNEHTDLTSKTQTDS